MVGLKTKKKEPDVRRILDIPIDKIRPNPGQPRKNFDIAELTSLAKSIARDGIIQPLSVRKRGEDYELISGERRLRAAKMVGLTTVPCIMFDTSERNSALMALIENLERSDLSFFEEAEALSNLVNLYGMTQGDAAVRLGMAQSTVANKLRLLKLPDDERKLVMAMGLTERHARALVQLERKQDRLYVLNQINKQGLNVEKTDKLVRQLLEASAAKKSYSKRSPVLKDVRLFFNTVNKAVEVMKLAGVDANATKKQRGNVIEYVITIPLA
ncbi:MAG: ParB/RepB/Spo0J family partition protein [Ruminococcus sp.]|nr:ParB/RepB/Spo0J family partition protein [Ruminococcus sp.]